MNSAPEEPTYHYSLRVKLIKAVDLPDSLAPNTPTCPRFKFGLLPLHGRESMEDLQKLLHPNGIIGDAALPSSLTPPTVITSNKTVHSLTDFRTHTPITSYVSSMHTRSEGQPDADIKFSSSKILSKAHFGAMDWHEEFVWDGILAPQLTVLAVELSTLLLPAMTAQNTPLNHLRASSSSSSIQNKLTNTMSMLLWGGASGGGGGAGTGATGVAGIAGRKSLHVHSSSQHSLVSQSPSKMSSSNLLLSSPLKQSSAFLDKNQLWIEEAMNNTSTTSTTTENSIRTKVSSSASNVLDKDLRIGTLLIPLSRLPIQDDTDRSSEDTPTLVVEKWYQLQSINTLNAAASTRGKVGVNLLPSILLAVAVYKHHAPSSWPTGSSTPVAAATANTTSTKELSSSTHPDSTGDDTDHFFPAFTSPTSTLQKSPLSISEDSLSSLGSGANANSAIRSRLDSTDRNRTPLDSMDKVRPRLDEFAAGTYRKRTSSTALLSPTALIVDKEEAYPFFLDQVGESEEEGEEEKGLDGPEQPPQLPVEPTYSLVEDGPLLSPGIVDHIIVVGVKNIVGALPTSNHALKQPSGWLDTIQPECCILEQYPSLDSYHRGGERLKDVPTMAEWFSFPQGCKLWRGEGPPTHEDLKRNPSSFPSLSSSTSEFDLTLNCPATFYWWVTCSNAVENDFQAVKTYGAVVCFYAPTPWGVDIMQGISMSNDGHKTIATTPHAVDKTLRIWSPVGICITSTLPIIGVLEEILLRMCKGLANSLSPIEDPASIIPVHKDIAELIFRYPEPIPSLIHVSIPFLHRDGNRILVTLPPLNTLPPLPHGGAVTQVCKLLGGEGLAILLSALLSECKILITSSDIANLAMAAEVACALIYPFRWQLPYVPVLPINMIEFLDAPLSYFLGVPSSNLKYVDRAILREVVVIDLDESQTTRPPDAMDQRRLSTSSFRLPLPLPTSIHSKIVDAVTTLLRVENELLEEQFGSRPFQRPNRLPKLECESVAERDFRIKISSLICSMLRGYQENISFVSATKPVFNQERFLKQAPFLLEDTVTSNSPTPNVKVTAGVQNTSGSSQNVVSARAKAFLTCLVNTQHFHGLIDNLDDDETLFFHDIMESLEKPAPDQKILRRESSSLKHLSAILEDREHKVPSFIVKRHSAVDMKQNNEGYQHEGTTLPLTHRILLPVVDETTGVDIQSNVQRLDILELYPWSYGSLFGTHIEEDLKGKRLISLKEALGEEKFNAWKKVQSTVNGNIAESDKNGPSNTSADPLDAFQSLSVAGFFNSKDAINFSLDTVSSNETDEVKAVRECLEAVLFGMRSKGFESKVRGLADIIGDAEGALQSPSARSFLLSILSKNDQLEVHERAGSKDKPTSGSISLSSIRLGSFRCLLRLCVAGVEACRRDHDYMTAYKLLARASSYRTSISTNGFSSNQFFLNMAKELCTHPIYGDFRLWEAVFATQKKDKQSNHTSKPLHGVDTDSGSYDAAVSTLYEMINYGLPTDFVLRFAAEVSQNIFSGSAKGHQLLLYVRRIAKKNTEEPHSMDKAVEINSHKKMSNNNWIEDMNNEHSWDEIAWYHPSILDPRALSNASLDRGDHEKSIYKQLAGNALSANSAQARSQFVPVEVDDPLNADGYIGRTPVTCLASFGNSVVVSGAIDGSVFYRFCPSSSSEGNVNVSGIRMECPSRGSELPSITCLGLVRKPYKQQDVNLMSACTGNYVVAGTSQGDLTIWSLKKVYGRYKVQFGDELRDDDSSAMYEGVSFDSGHRNGVTCIDVPSSTYRPNAFITGGGGGLIHLWAFRPEDIEVAHPAVNSISSSRPTVSSQKKKQDQFALRPKITLSGNMAKIFSLKTAWHTDLLASGSFDGNIRLWDVGEKFTCINSGKCHTGFVTHLHFWDGPTIVSGSSDRSISLWDSRIGAHPYLSLKYHNAPISDILIGSKRDYSIISAGADGIVACWDLRNVRVPKDSSLHEVMSRPQILMHHKLSSKNALRFSESIYLASGLNYEKNLLQNNTLVSVGVDGSVNEWDLNDNGKRLAKDVLLHTDAVSVFRSFTEKDNLIAGGALGGFLSSSWDGSVRVRSLQMNNSKN